MYHTVNTLADAMYFQSILNSIQEWCVASQLSVNIEKCCMLHIGKTNHRYSYGLNGLRLPTPELVKDLGVLIDSSLLFSSHIDSIISKARRRCALYFKSFLSRDLSTMKQFYIIYVRPILEYGSTVWNPLSQTQINALEKVQRFFTNRIPGCTFLPYSRRLSILSLDSLQKRRTVADLVCVHSIVSGSLTTFLTPHLLFEPPSITRGHNLRLIRPILKLSQSYQNLISRTAPVWNKLPTSILSANSRLLFRKRLSLYCVDPCK